MNSITNALFANRSDRSWPSELFCRGSGWMRSLVTKNVITKKMTLTIESRPIVSW